MSILRFMLRRGVVFVLVLGLGFAWIAPTHAGPTEDEQGDLAKPLEEKITVDLIGTPLPQAIDTISRESGVNILISPNYVGILAGQSITLSIKELPVVKALNLMCLATENDWYIREGVVLIAPKKFVRSLRVKTEVYDIRELIQSVPNYLGPDLSIDGTLSNTNSGGSAAGTSESYGKGGGGGSLFGGDSDSDLGDDNMSRSELVEQVTALIQSTAGTPDEWLDDDSTITEFNGNLIVKTTPEVHAQVGALLINLSKTSGKMVAVEGQFYAVPRSMVDKLEGGLVLDAKAYAKFADGLKRGADTNTRRFAASRTVCFNSQRVYVYAGSDQALVSDIEPIPDTFSIDPTISTSHNGAVMDIKPTITIDGKHISIAVRSEAVLRSGAGTTGVPVGHNGVGESLSISTSGEIDGTAKGAGKDGEDAELDGRVRQSGSIKKPGNAKQTGTVELGLPKQDIMTYRTNIRVPDGGAVVLSGVTSEFKGIDADGMEMIFVLRARIIN